MIEMRLLEILSAFAQEGTQAAAAEKLHISQPTLSSSMKKLEEEIGAPLFERTKNRMALNENGQAAAEYAGRILREEAAMRKHIQDLERRKHTVSFALCSHSPVAKMTMVASQAFPDMQLSTAFCAETEKMVQGLVDHLYTFILTESPVLEERTYGFPCYTERLVALIPEDQPEAKRKSVSLDELKEHQMLFFCNGGAWERYIRRKLKDGEFIPQTNFADYCSLINSLPVWAFGSDTQVTALSVPPGHRAVPVSDEDAHLDYWCSCLKEKKKEADLLRSFL